MSAEPIDFVAAKAEHRGNEIENCGPDLFCLECDAEWPCLPYRLAEEAERLDHAARDYEGAWKKASAVGDRFRDVVSEVLDLDENPGDDELVRLLRKHHGKSGPEPRRWRDFLTGAVAHLEANGLRIGANLADPQQAS